MMNAKASLRSLFARINTLPVKIFTLFWLLFIVLMMIAFIIPRLDARLYRPLESNDVVYYKNEVAQSVKNNQILHLLANSGLLELTKTKSLRPVLVDKNDHIIGARADELPALRQFVINAYDFALPMQKRFVNLQVTGPFQVHVDISKKDYSLYFVEYVKEQNKIASLIFDYPFSIIISLMLILSPLLWWLVASISGPIKQLQEAANQVALGNFKIDKQLEITGASEVRQVGESFNRMAEAIEELILSRQTLLSSISHELRTPLTRLQLSLSLLRRKVGDNTEIKRIQTETERLDRMIKDLLFLSHKHLKSQLFREIIPITEIWEDVREDAEFEAEQLNIECKFKQNIFYPAQYKISANRELLASAVENMLRNALKYAEKKVEITEYLGNGFFFICVDDDGIGVPESEYDSIFKPFYRVNPDEPTQKEGTGLGLAIVHNVAQQHRGHVWAESSPFGGLRITLQLPLHK